jgi:hypothetical protein
MAALTGAGDGTGDHIAALGGQTFGVHLLPCQSRSQT